MLDQWWFWNCANVPNELPEFLSILDIDPNECIGWGLNKEMAEKIVANKALDTIQSSEVKEK
jgi:succinate dehydrogenase flavin-adding protein (antitoxin of CptAB toxin-antitoxin module)